jgi:hypothetical protein
MEENKKTDLLDYLDKVLSFASSKLVGKVMKRIEIIDDTELLKKELKELIYEHAREISDIFAAYKDGYEMSFFVFLDGKNKKENTNGRNK